MLLIIFIAFALWMYILFVAADTGYVQGWGHGIDRYSSFNIVKYFIIIKRKISKSAK